MSFCIITTTFPDEKSTKEIIECLLENRLVACVQMVPIQSYYHWDGKIAESKECLLIMKTQSDLYDEIEQIIKEYHPYTLPQLIQVPIDKGLPEYLQWIIKETIKY